MKETEKLTEQVLCMGKFKRQKLEISLLNLLNTAATTFALYICCSM